MQREFDYIVLDCPPRLTTARVNALAAADCILIPVLLDERSTEGAPRLLRWVHERRAALFPGLGAAGVLANKTRGTARASLVHRENDVWSELVPACHDATVRMLVVVAVAPKPRSVVGETRHETRAPRR